ncbi:MAG: hypothetical protein HW391_1160 [Chloroflexi bacterium]|nr:hypothetical protein [Chloroflexota bacterium]
MTATRSRSTLGLRLAAAALLSLGALWAPAGAAASCLIPPAGDLGWQAADVVFVGTVTGVANGARWATVRVEEVWKGPDQPVDVVVRGGPEGNTATSVDRTYNVGTRYLFAVSMEDGTLADNSCSPTTQADAIDLAALRPAEVRQPIGAAPTPASGGLDLSGLAGPVLIVGIVGGLLVATVFLARRREA